MASVPKKKREHRFRTRKGVAKMRDLIALAEFLGGTGMSISADGLTLKETADGVHLGVEGGLSPVELLCNQDGVTGTRKFMASEFVPL